MTVTGILLLIVGVIIGTVLVLFIKRESQPDQQQQIKDAFGNLSKEALDQNIAILMKIADSKFNEHLKSSDAQLEEKKKLIDFSLEEMKKQLQVLNKQTSELKGQMEESSKGISELSDTTSQLRQILSSSQARGQWGERMVEDILVFIGLSEGINYKKHTQEGSDRPDFTFYLPDGKHINMDVKFPLSHYERYLTADNESEMEVEKNAFMKAVRNHIKAISGRSYIDTGAGTVDYVLMFIPNESIYSFLNQEDHNLIDFSLGKKIMLCSPVTLYAILSLIRQAVSSFYIEQKAGEMQQLVVAFRKQWTNFVNKMERLGKTIETVHSHYEQLSGARRNQLEKPMEKITEMQLGKGDYVEELEQKN